jgi:superfamily II DNA/RNA helicase
VQHGDKNAIVRDLAAGHGRTLLFTRTKHSAKRLAETLTKSGIPSVDLHGNLSQKQRERNLSAFSRGNVRVLVATDIAARGIHVDGIDLVVHVDPPADPKTYLHRSGRTARAGASGTVVTLATPNQNGIVRTLSKHAGVTPERSVVTPGHAVIEDLRGPAAPHVEPSAAPPAFDAPRRGGRPQSGRPQSGRPQSGRPQSSRSGGKPQSARTGKPQSDWAPSGKPQSGKPRSAESRSGESASRPGGRRPSGPGAQRSAITGGGRPTGRGSSSRRSGPPSAGR